MNHDHVGALALEVLPDRLAICRLDPDQGLPDLDLGDGFLSLTFTDDEISVVCEEATAPTDGECSRGWRCLRVRGPLDFELVGVLASLSRSLADAGISIFAVSTYETDHILVRHEHLANAVSALTKAGHLVRDDTEL